MVGADEVNAVRLTADPSVAAPPLMQSLKLPDIKGGEKALESEIQQRKRDESCFKKKKECDSKSKKIYIYSSSNSSSSGGKGTNEKNGE